MEGLETKEITLVKQRASKEIREVGGIRISSTPTLEVAKELLSKITNTQKGWKGIKESMTKPANESLRNIRAFFAPIEDNLATANKELKGKMEVYNEKVKAEAEVKKAEIAEKAESGELGFEKASKKMEKVEEKVEAMPTRRHREVEIVDETKIPQQYWELNMVALRKDALSGIEISGIKVVERDIIVSR